MSRFICTAVLCMALGLSFFPLPGGVYSTCVAQLAPGPDPNTHGATFQIGLVAPWFEGSYSWGAKGRGWMAHAIRCELLVLHLVLPTIAAVMLWGGRGEEQEDC